MMFDSDTTEGGSGSKWESMGSSEDETQLVAAFKQNRAKKREKLVAAFKQKNLAKKRKEQVDAFKQKNLAMKREKIFYPKKHTKDGSSASTSNTAENGDQTSNCGHLTEADGIAALIDASEQGHESCVRTLIEAGVGVNIKTAEDLDKYHTTGLIQAARCGRVGCMKLLLEKGADIDGIDRYGYTALKVAAECHEAECLKLLIEAGANVNATHKQAKIFLDEVENANILRDSIEENQYLHDSALMVGVNSLECVEVLLKAHADVNHYNQEGNGALQYALDNGEQNLEIVRLLVRAGANGNHSKKEMTSLINHVVKKGQNGYMKVFIEEGVQVDEPDRKGDTPLQVAARMGHRKCVKMLIASKCDVNHRNYDDESVIEAALLKNRVKCADELFEAGAQLRDFKALAAAVNDGDRKTVDWVVYTGSDPNYESQAGLTPLMVAASKCKNADVLQSLILAGANVNFATGISGVNALMSAASIGNARAVEVLIASGATVNRSDARGNTALLMAVSAGHVDAVDVLLKAGADVNHSNAVGNTALMVVFTGQKLLPDLDTKKSTRAKELQDSLSMQSLVTQMKRLKKTVKNFQKSKVSKTQEFIGNESATMFIVASLLASHAQVNSRNKKGMTALLFAALYKNATGVLQLLNADADVIVRSANYMTPLLASVKMNAEQRKLPIHLYERNLYSVKAVQILLKTGANVNLRSSDGNNAFEEYLLNSPNTLIKKDMLMLLMAAGEDSQLIQEQQQNVGARRRSSITPSIITCVRTGYPAPSDTDPLNTDPFNTAPPTSDPPNTPPPTFDDICLEATLEIQNHQGCTPTQGDSPRKEKTDIMQEFLAETEVGFELKDMCRVKVRGILLSADPYTNLYVQIPRLGLPSLINEYLLYDMSLDKNYD